MDSTQSAQLLRVLRPAPATGFGMSSSVEDSYLDFLLQHGDQGMCVWNTRRGCRYHSQNWMHIIGHTASNCMGHRWLKMMHSRCFDNLMHLMDKVADNPASNGSAIRCRFQDAEQRWHWYDLTLYRSPDSGPEHREFYILIQDAEKHMLQEEALNQAKLDAEIALKSRAEFLSNMSHELRTPLNAIIGFAQMMGAGLHGALEHPKHNEYVDNIQESGQLLLSKISDLLEISDLESGQIALHETVTRAGDLISDAIEIHSHKLFRKAITVHKDICNPCLSIRGDRLKLTQCISHLLANATTHTECEGAVTIRMRRNTDGSIVITVTDTGRGIEADHLHTIRAGLEKTDSLFATEPKGIRLGLALTNCFVRLHGGKLALESVQGRGTTATLTIPALRVMDQSAPR